MYINLNTLFSLKNPLMLPLLLTLRHASKIDVSEKVALLMLDDCSMEDLLKDDMIKYIKGSRKMDILQTMRLGKNGTKFLNVLDEPMVEDEDIQIFNWLADIYKKKGKVLGNQKKTKRLIASFREKSGIDKNHLAFLCNAFIQDEEQQEWSFKLEYVFWKPSNLYQTKFVLDDSKLWVYYQSKKGYFDNKFEQIKNS